MSQPIRINFNNLAANSSVAAGTVVQINSGQTTIDTQVVNASGYIMSSALSGSSTYTLALTGAFSGSGVLYTDGISQIYNISVSNAGSTVLSSLNSNYKILNLVDGNIHYVAASYVVGIVNNATSQQTVTLNIYDAVNNTGGNPLVSVAAGMGADQIITYPSPGLPLANGLTAQLSAVPTGTSVQVLYM